MIYKKKRRTNFNHEKRVVLEHIEGEKTLQRMNLKAYILFFIVVIISFFTSFVLHAVPLDVNYHGRIIKPDSNPLESSNVTFTINVYDSTKTCLLYQETQVVDMTGSNGIFSLYLGTGTNTGNGVKVTGGGGAATFAEVYSNSVTFDDLVGNCVGGFDPTGTPSAGRTLSVSFNDGSGSVAISPDLKSSSVPSSLYAESASSLDGLVSGDFLQVDVANGVTQSNVKSLLDNSDISTLNLHNHDTHNDGRYARLGSSNSFSGNISMGSGTTLGLGSYDNSAQGTMTGSLGAGDAGKTWYNSDTGKLMYWNGSTTQTVGDGLGFTPLDVAGSNKLTANMDANSNKILNLTTPTNNSDAANKSYVDSAVSTGTGSYVPLAGGTMTGVLTVNNDFEVDSTNHDFFVDDSTGNVGVGTNAPSTGLDVISDKTLGAYNVQLKAMGGTNQDGGMVIQSSGTGVYQRLMLWGSGLQSGPTITGYNGSALFVDSASNGDINYRANGTGQHVFSTAGSEKVRIDNNGNVGIGLTTPSTKLEVSGIVKATDFKIGSNSLCQSDGTNCPPSGGSGTVTSVGAGTGLTGGPITTSGTLAVDVGTTANKIVQLNASSQLPAVSGALLTNLNGSNISSGTVPDARLSTNVSLLGSSIDSSEITAGTIVNNNISSSAAIAWSKIDKTGASPSDIGAGDGDFKKDGSVAMTGNIQTGNHWLSNDGGNEGVFVDTNGNVGVGTSTPSKRFEVKSTTSDAAIVMNAPDASQDSYLAWYADDAQSFAIWRDRIDDKLKFVNTGFGAGNTLMTIQSDGSVGIGTQTPSQKLEVNGTVRATNFVVGSNSLCQSDGTNCPAFGTGDFKKDGSVAMTGNIKTGGNWLSNDGDSEGVFVDTSGNVGIGISSPSARLQVSSGAIKMDNAWQMQWGSGLQTSIVGGSSSGSEFLELATAGNPSLHIDNSSNVGIGTQTPSQKLEVNGTVKATNFVVGSNSLCQSDGTNCPAFGTGDFKKDGSVAMTGNLMLGGHWLNNNGGTQGIYVDTSGNVGVQTSSVASELSINGAADLTTLYVGEPRGISNPKHIILLYDSGVGAAGVTKIQGNHYGIGDLPLLLNPSGGNVGVGVNGDPSYKLEVNGSLNATSLYVGGTQMTPQTLYAESTSGTATVSGSQGGVAIGWGASATNNTGAALGNHAAAPGNQSVAVGPYTNSSGDFSWAGGYGSTSSGESAMTLGSYVSASTFKQTTLGTYNTDISGTATSWVSTDPLLVVGNGTGSGGNSSNAMVILKNGNVGIGKNNPSYLLDVNGTLRANGAMTSGGVVSSTGGFSTGGSTLSGVSDGGIYVKNAVTTGNTIYSLLRLYNGGGTYSNELTLGVSSTDKSTKSANIGTDGDLTFSFLGATNAIMSPGGKLGLGIATPPPAQLTVKTVGETSNGNILTQSNSSTNVSGIDFGLNTGFGFVGFRGGSSTNIPGGAGFYFQSAISAYDLIFGLTNSDQLHIQTSTGEVGIGISNPNYKLDVTGDINSSTGLRVSGTQVCQVQGVHRVLTKD